MSLSKEHIAYIVAWAGGGNEWRHVDAVPCELIHLCEWAASSEEEPFPGVYKLDASGLTIAALARENERLTKERDEWSPPEDRVRILQEEIERLRMILDQSRAPYDFDRSDIAALLKKEP